MVTSQNVVRTGIFFYSGGRTGPQGRLDVRVDEELVAGRLEVGAEVEAEAVVAALWPGQPTLRIRLQADSRLFKLGISGSW